MRKALALFLTIPLVGCVVGDGTETGGGGGGGGGGSGSGSGSGSGTGTGGGITGNITENTTWTGAVTIAGITTIDPGVTVTVEPGSTLTFAAVASLKVSGIFDVKGTGAGPVEIKPETTGFNGIAIAAGGEVKYSHVEQWGGNITTLGATAKLTIADSSMSRASGDFILMNGGTIDMSYSRVGLEPGESDTTHCDLHFGGSGNVIKVTHSILSTSSYGLMFYGGMNADFKYNNWFSNTVDVDVSATSPVTGDFSNGWFEKGAPTGTGITATNLSATRLVACDGGNDATCAGPRP